MTPKGQRTKEHILIPRPKRSPSSTSPWTFTTISFWSGMCFAIINTKSLESSTLRSRDHGLTSSRYSSK